MPDMPGTGGVPGDAVTLRAENARLRMLLEDKDAQIAALKTQNAELAERVARLERLISRNNGNSSMPPSTDDLPEAQAQTTQYDRHEVRCACGRVPLADAPPRRTRRSGR